MDGLSGRFIDLRERCDAREIRQGVELAPVSKRPRLEAWLESDLRLRYAERILGVDEGIADRWGILLAEARSRGNVLPGVDALIAATALTHSLTVATRNVRHFEAAGALTINPWC